MRNFTCPVNDFQTHVRRKFHCSVAVTQKSGHINDLQGLQPYFSLRCYAATPQTPVRLNKSSPVCCQYPLPKSLVEGKKSYVSYKPINTEQTDCSLSGLKWAARCVLSRQLNFRQLNILGNVWKLNCEGEQRAAVRMKRCGGTQKALSYHEALSEQHTHTHTQAGITHPLTGVSISYSRWLSSHFFLFHFTQFHSLFAKMALSWWQLYIATQSFGSQLA